MQKNRQKIKINISKQTAKKGKQTADKSKQTADKCKQTGASATKKIMQKHPKNMRKKLKFLPRPFENLNLEVVVWVP